MNIVYCLPFILSIVLIPKINGMDPSSLKEQAAKKVAEKITIESDDFAKFPFDIQQLILQQKKDIPFHFLWNFITKTITNIKDLDQLVVNKLPDSVWIAFMNEKLDVESFFNLINSVSPELQKKITQAFFVACTDLMNPSPVMYVYDFSITKRNPLGFDIGSTLIEGVFPIEMYKKSPVLGTVYLMPKNIKLIFDKFYLISLFLFLKIEQSITKNIPFRGENLVGGHLLKKNYESNSSIIDLATLQKLHFIFNQTYDEYIKHYDIKKSPSVEKLKRFIDAAIKKDIRAAYIGRFILNNEGNWESK